MRASYINYQWWNSSTNLQKDSLIALVFTVKNKIKRWIPSLHANFGRETNFVFREKNVLVHSQQEIRAGFGKPNGTISTWSKMYIIQMVI